MLGRYAFPEALARFAKGLRQLAVKGGRPEAYHETITAAFLALIGERRLDRDYRDWEDFAANNADLLSKDLLRHWYEPQVLNSVVARRTFVLPKRRIFMRAHSSATVDKCKRALAAYAVVFSLFIIWASARTAINPGPHGAGIQSLAFAEIIGGLFFVWRKTRQLGLVILLVVFAVAAVIELHLHEWPVRFRVLRSLGATGPAPLKIRAHEARFLLINSALAGQSW